MRSPIRKISIVLLILSTLIGVERLSHTLTDGFSTANITSNLPYNPAWEVSHLPEDEEELKVALNQPYHYLESGSQSFVFISNDEKYVIKFFKHKRWRLSPLVKYLPLPPSLEKKRKRWKEKKKETVYDTFGSCAISYTEFRKETGVLFVHLNPDTSKNRPLTIKNRIGMKRKIDLNSVPFIIQRKAIPTDKYLLSLKKKGDHEKAKEALSALIAFTHKRAQKGYSDKDPHLIRNFGFINDHAAQIDIGGFHRDPKKDLHYYQTREIAKIERKLTPWLEENYPELVPYAKKMFSSLSS